MVELTVGYGAHSRTQQYFVNFWSVREDSASAMDGDHNALSNKDDMWSVLAESTPDAPTAVMRIDEARATNRLMFVNDDTEDIPLECKSFTPHGSAIEFTIARRMGQRAERGARAGKEHGPPSADRLRSDMVRSLPHDGSVRSSSASRSTPTGRRR